MASVNPYLTFNGNAEEAFNFYKSVFGGEFATCMRWKDMTFEGAPPCAPQDENKIMHISLPIGDSVLMASDSPSNMPSTSVGEGFSISVSTDNEEQTRKFFEGVGQGGEVTMPLQDTFWGAYFGMCKDKYGVNWMFNYQKAPVPA